MVRLKDKLCHSPLLEEERKTMLAIMAVQPENWEILRHVCRQLQYTATSVGRHMERKPLNFIGRNVTKAQPHWKPFCCLFKRLNSESQADWVVLFLVIIHIGKNAHAEVLVNIHSNRQQEKQVPINTWMEKENVLQ